MLKFVKSPRKNKKYRAIYSKGDRVYTTDFGDNRYQHYEDKTGLGLYSHLDHKNETRRRNYRKRHKAIKDKFGRIAKDVKYSPAWFSWNFLW